MGTLGDVQQLVVTAGAVANVLPEAFSDASRERTEAIEVALGPVVVGSLQAFARDHADFLGEVLAPTIGAAVRKALAMALEAIMQRFNEALERSLSWQSIQWRIEARRTGRPFAEVVLLKTLVYRVEQVLLVHVPTGLVLQHLVAEGVPSHDPDQVSAMLSAIDSFSREALQEGGAHLREIALGDLSVWVDWDQGIAVAAVIRGTAPRTFLEVIRETRERVYLANRERLAAFVDDVTPFERTRPTLGECLREQRRKPARRGQVVVACLAALVIAFALTAWVRTHQRAQREAQQLQTYQQVLDNEPGLVVTSAATTHGHYRLDGFRDPLAAEPAQVVVRADLPAADLRFAPFVSLDSRMVAKRARRALQPPDGVAVDARGATLHLSGEATRAWIEHALIVAEAVNGGSRVEHSALRAGEDLLRIRSVAALLEEERVTFQPGSASVDGSDRVMAAATLIRSLRERADSASLPMCVIAVGNADPTGSAELNQSLAAERASSVANALAERGAQPDLWRDADRNQNSGAREVRFIVAERTYPTPCGGVP